MDLLEREYFPGENGPLFFHARQLRVQQSERLPEPWSRLTAEQRYELKDRIYGIVQQRRGVVFGCAVEKQYSQARVEDPYERAFEDLISRFDLYVGRMNRLAEAQNKEEQRGLVVLAESSYEKTIALLARRLQQTGTRWRSLHNITDVPLFAPARDSRLLQYADFCANAIYGRYNSKLIGDFDKIAHKFDREGGIIHGLSHLSTDSNCTCLACFSRLGRPQGLTSD